MLVLSGFVDFEALKCSKLCFAIYMAVLIDSCQRKKKQIKSSQIALYFNRFQNASFLFVLL